MGVLFGKEQVVSTEGILSSIGNFFKWIWEKLVKFVKMLVGHDDDKKTSFENAMLRLENRMELLLKRVNDGEVTKLDLSALSKEEWSVDEFGLVFLLSFQDDAFKKRVEEAVQSPYGIIGALLEKFNTFQDDMLKIDQHETEKTEAHLQGGRDAVKEGNDNFLKALKHQKDNLYFYKEILLNGIAMKGFYIQEDGSWRVESLDDSVSVIAEKAKSEYKSHLQSKLTLEEGKLTNKEKLVKMLMNTKDFFKKAKEISSSAGDMLIHMAMREHNDERILEEATEQMREEFEPFRQVILSFIQSIGYYCVVLKDLRFALDSWATSIEFKFKK